MVRRYVRPLLPLVVLALVASMAGPAGAFHGSTLPLLGRVEFSGPEWAAHRITVPAGSKIDVEVFFSDTDADVASGSVLMTRNGAPGGGGLIRFGCEGTARVQASIGDPAISINESTPSPCASGVRGGFALTFSGLQAGVYEVAATAAATGGLSGYIEFRASEGAVSTAAANGDDVVYARNGDFGGTANAKVGAGLAEAQAILGGHVPTNIGGGIWGWFINGSLLPVGPLSYDGPNGSEGPGGAFLFWGDDTGDYDFKVDAKADAGALFCCNVDLLVADVVLPE